MELPPGLGPASQTGHTEPGPQLGGGVDREQGPEPQLSGARASPGREDLREGGSLAGGGGEREKRLAGLSQTPLTMQSSCFLVRPEAQSGKATCPR